MAYGTLGKWKEAVAAHKEAVRLNPNYGGAYYNLGVDYWRIGDKKAATEQYEKLRTLNPNNANLLYFQINKKPPPKG